MSSTASSYLLLFRDSAANYAPMSPEQVQNTVRDFYAWHDALAAEGKVIGANPLEPAGRVVRGAGGSKIVDGPYSEAKEVLGGYFLVKAASLEEATEMAQDCPSLKHGMVVEVRPVAEICPIGKSLGMTVDSLAQTAASA